MFRTKNIKEIRPRETASPEGVLGAHFSANAIPATTAKQTNHWGMAGKPCLPSNAEKLRASRRNGVTSRNPTKLHQKPRGSQKRKGRVIAAATAPALASSRTKACHEHFGSKKAMKGTARIEYCFEARNRPSATGSHAGALLAAKSVVARVITIKGSVQP